MTGEILGWLGKMLLYSSIWKRQQKKFNKRVADDVALAVQKAHLGKLPKGVYCDQIIWSKKMTREQLCVPLDAQTLQRMSACTVVRCHEAECCGLDASLPDFGSEGTVTLTVSVRFDGELPDGQPVKVDVRKALLTGRVERDKMTAWTLRELREIRL
ncbi:MAG: hypothetical protein IKK57_09280 [Clostridia bacterium]|nr:hypothetical protein [Clostridia bacterium]